MGRRIYLAAEALIREAADLIPERSDITLIELNRALRRLSPAMRLIIVLPNNDMMHPVIDELQPDGFLTKPFYLPDLLDVIDAIMRTREIGASFPIESAEQVHSKVEQPDAPAWLTDVDRAAQCLARLFDGVGIPGSFDRLSRRIICLCRGIAPIGGSRAGESRKRNIGRVAVRVIWRVSSTWR